MLHLVWLLTCGVMLVTGQRKGGRHVCAITKQSVAQQEEYRTVCGWGWGAKKCDATRYVTKYISTYRPFCCPGWQSPVPGTRDCDIPICFGRTDREKGTCLNGGKCVAPDTCSCAEGYKPPECKDIDECAGEHGCSHGCRNLHGSYECVCPKGYGLAFPDKHNCYPTCFGIEPPGKCLNDHRCRNIDYCECGKGYAEPKCEDVDECTTSPCHQICTNTLGSFHCSCNDGYLLQSDDRSCEPQCQHVPFGICPNGGYCSEPDVCACVQGFSSPACQDIDECSADHNCTHTCHNTEGSYTCSCDMGYEMAADELTCEDVDECKLRNGGCLHVCTNSPGSFLCECNGGLEILPDGKTCAARCHREWEPGVCPNGGTCHSFHECHCAYGFEGDSCDNINECANNNGGCSHECHDNHGSFTCSCPEGYVLSNGNICSDTDECQGAHGCKGFCVNLLGSYECGCRSGFRLISDGVGCEDIDECALRYGGCSHICENTSGSFVCKCPHGSLLSADRITCFKPKVCQSEDETSCWVACKSNSDGRCTCPPGMTLFIDNVHCMDPCTSNPCLHGGSCKLGKTGSYRCDCGETGYLGDHCQYGSLDVPLSVEIWKGIDLSNFSIHVTSDQDTVLHATSEAKVKIQPNPIIIWKAQDSANVTLRAEQTGVFYISFKVTNPQIRKQKYKTKVTSRDVFVRRQLIMKRLPEGCFYLDLPQKNHGQIFRSTRPWFQLKGEKKIYFTFGIAYNLVPNSALPLSNDGLQITFGSSLHISRLVPTREEEHGIRHEDPRDKDCEELFVTPQELEEFNNARSLLRTFFYGLSRILPYWYIMDIEPFEGKKDNPQFYRTQIYSGKTLHREKLCIFDEVDDDASYIVFLFTDATTYIMAGQVFHIPETKDTTPYCFVVDFVKTKTFVTITNGDMGNTFHGISIADAVTQMEDIHVEPTRLGIIGGWDYRKLYDPEFFFFNGDTIFEYPELGKVKWFTWMHAKKHFDTLNEDDLFLEVKGKVYSDMETDKIFTHMFTTNNTYFLFLQYVFMKFDLKIMGTVIPIEMEVDVYDDRAIISPGGDGDRKACGMVSNPPGVFYHTTLKKALSVGTAIPLFPILEVKGDVHFFLTFDEKKDKAMGADEVRLQSLLFLLSKRVDMFKKFLRKLKNKNSPAWKARMMGDMETKAMEISKAGSTFDTANLTVKSFADFVHDLLIETVALGEELKIFESRLNLAFDPDGDRRIFTVKKAFQLIEGQVKGIWWENLDSSTPFFPKDTVMGVKAFAGLTVLGQSIGLDVELVASSEGVMKCSDLYEYYDHIDSKNVIRGKGIITVRKSGLMTTAYNRLNELWHLFPPAVGGGVELAFSRDRPVFTIKLTVIWMWFGLKISGSLFITNKEVAAMAEVMLLQMFRVRLTLRFAVPRQLTDLSLSVRGEFLPGDENSLETSLWDAVKRVLKATHRKSQKRLTQANTDIKSAQAALANTKIKIGNAADGLNQKQVLFDNAVKRLENAKKALEKAKLPFRQAKQALSVAIDKVDRLCKLEDCHRKCTETLDASKCKTGKKPKTGCITRKRCSTWLPQTSCVLKNAGCKVLRGLAYAGLAVAKAAVHIPVLALDGAKAIVSLAQIVVDKSRFVLDVAKTLYSGASLALDLAKASLQITHNLIETIKVSVSYVFKLFDALVTNVLQKFLDFRRCGFEVELSVKNWFVVGGFCEVNFLSKRWVKHSFTINFKDIFTSTFGIAKWMIHAVKQEDDENRRKREAGTSAGFNSFNASEAPTIFSFEYQSWPLRCDRYRAITSYLNHSVDILKNISREVMKEANMTDRELNEIENNEDFNGALTLDDLPVDLDVALNDFNLTRYELNRALKNAQLGKDEILLATLDLRKSVKKHNQVAIQTLRDEPVTLSWLAHMDTVFYIGDCGNFRDCVAWSFGELFVLTESLDPRLLGNFTKSLTGLQLDFEELMQNDNKTLNQTTDPNIDLSVLNEMLSVYCGTLPAIKEQPKNATFLAGDIGMFTCKAEAYPSPTYYWFHGDDLVASGSGLITLVLYNVSTANEGLYSCVAGNHIGNVSSDGARLDVVYPPRIVTDLPERYTLHPAQVKPLIAVVAGKPTPHVVWSICSSKRCFSWRSTTFPHISNHFRGGELICKYTAHNDYGEIDSREMLVVLYDKELAVPSKLVTFSFTVVAMHIDTFESIQKLSNVSLIEIFQELLTNTYVNMDGSVRMDVLSVDSEEHAVSFVLNPKHYVLERAELTKRLVEEILAEMNITLEKIRRDAREGVIIYNTSQVIYSFSQADEVFDEPTKFFCNGSRIFRRPYYCLQRPAAVQLPPPQHLVVTKSADNIRMEWEAPFYLEYFVKDYSILICRENELDVSLNTSSTIPSVSLPSFLCGDECEIHVSALTSARRSLWTVAHVGAVSSELSNGGQIKPESNFRYFKAVVLIPVTFVSALVALCVISIVLASCKHRYTSRRKIHVACSSSSSIFSNRSKTSFVEEDKPVNLTRLSRDNIAFVPSLCRDLLTAYNQRLCRLRNDHMRFPPLDDAGRYARGDNSNDQTA